jgi:hypothetical protein
LASEPHGGSSNRRLNRWLAGSYRHFKRRLESNRRFKAIFANVESDYLFS